MPWLLLVLLTISLVLLLYKKWFTALLLLIICISLNWYFECIPFRLWALRDQQVKRSLKVMSFNINGTDKDIINRADRIVKIINEKNPDIVFLAEFYEDDLNVLDTLLRKSFPYSTCVGGFFHYFYSKYPLGLMSKLNSCANGSGVFKCKVSIYNDSITLYGCHLASNNYTVNKEYITPDSINSCKKLKTYLKDIERASFLRGKEASVLVDDMPLSLPILVMGDFNDVGGAKSIRLLEKKGLKDAWWKGGCSYGATIHNPLPYRIDHIMFSEKMHLNKIEIVSSDGLSDHDALYAEFSL